MYHFYANKAISVQVFLIKSKKLKFGHIHRLDENITLNSMPLIEIYTSLQILYNGK